MQFTSTLNSRSKPVAVGDELPGDLDGVSIRSRVVRLLRTGESQWSVTYELIAPSSEARAKWKRLFGAQSALQDQPYSFDSHFSVR